MEELLKYASFIVLFCVYQTSCSITTINLADSCDYEIYKPNEDRSFYLVWDGNRVEDSYCSMGFKGEGKIDIYDEYKVCVEPVSFNISCSDIDVTVTYNEGIFPTERRSYSCFSNPTKWCSDPDQYINVKLSNAASSLLSGQSHFKLKITAIKTFNHLAMVGGIVGGVIVLIIVIIVVVAAVWIITRRKQLRNAVQLQGQYNTRYSN